MRSKQALVYVTATALFLGSSPAVSGGHAAVNLDGPWRGGLATLELEPIGAVVGALATQSNRRSEGPVLLGLPGVDAIDAQILEMTQAGNGQIHGSLHTSVLTADGDEVQLQLVFSGVHVEETGAIIATGSLHLAGLGDVTLQGEELATRIFSAHPGEGLIGDLDGDGALDLDAFDRGLIRETMGGYWFGGQDLGNYFGGQDLGNYFVDVDMDAGFGGQDLGNYFGGQDLGHYFGGQDLGHYFGVEEVDDYLADVWRRPTDPIGQIFDDSTFRGMDFGGWLTDGYQRTVGVGVSSSVSLDQSGSVDVILMLAPAE
jgi:hypothetical protein